MVQISKVSMSSPFTLQYICDCVRLTFLKLTMFRKLSHSNETFDYSYSANGAGMDYRNKNHKCTRLFLVEIHSGYKIIHKLKLIGTVIHFNDRHNPVSVQKQ